MIRIFAKNNDVTYNDYVKNIKGKTILTNLKTKNANANVNNNVTINNKKIVSFLSYNDFLNITQTFYKFSNLKKKYKSPQKIIDLKTSFLFYNKFLNHVKNCECCKNNNETFFGKCKESMNILYPYGEYFTYEIYSELSPVNLNCWCNNDDFVKEEENKKESTYRYDDTIHVENSQFFYEPSLIDIVNTSLNDIVKASLSGKNNDYQASLSGKNNDYQASLSSKNNDYPAYLSGKNNDYPASLCSKNNDYPGSLSSKNNNKNNNNSSIKESNDSSDGSINYNKNICIEGIKSRDNSLRVCENMKKYENLTSYFMEKREKSQQPYNTNTNTNIFNIFIAELTNSKDYAFDATNFETENKHYNVYNFTPIYLTFTEFKNTFFNSNTKYFNVSDTITEKIKLSNQFFKNRNNEIEPFIISNSIKKIYIEKNNYNIMDANTLIEIEKETKEYISLYDFSYITNSLNLDDILHIINENNVGHNYDIKFKIKVYYKSKKTDIPCIMYFNYIIQNNDV